MRFTEPAVAAIRRNLRSPSEEKGCARAKGVPPAVSDHGRERAAEPTEEPFLMDFPVCPARLVRETGGAMFVLVNARQLPLRIGFFAHGEAHRRPPNSTMTRNISTQRTSVSEIIRERRAPAWTRGAFRHPAASRRAVSPRQATREPCEAPSSIQPTTNRPARQESRERPRLQPNEGISQSLT
jgi:hypothetical protein